MMLVYLILGLGLSMATAEVEDPWIYYPKIGQCDPKIVSEIKKNWGPAGPPKNPMESISGRYIAKRTSYDYMNDINKCILYDFQLNTFNVTFIHKDGHPVSLNYTIEQKDESVVAFAADKSNPNQSRIKWYFIDKPEDVEIVYVCSLEGDLNKTPLVAIFVEESKFNKPNIKSIIESKNNLLESWGLNLNYKYGAECAPPSA